MTIPAGLAPFLVPLLFVIVIVTQLRRLQINRFDHSEKAFEPTTSDFDTSIIMTMYSLGVKLETVSQGSLDNNPYTLLVTTPLDINLEASALSEEFMHTRKIGSDLPAAAFHSPSGKVIMRVTLPTASLVHFAGFSLEDEGFRTLLGSTGIDTFMASVSLEGDFPDYFRLYCSKGHEIELREVLDPTRMEFLVSFCKNLNWELFENTLYFSEAHSSTSDNDNNVSTVQAAEEFAQKILPTLQNMSHAISSNVSDSQPLNPPPEPS